VAAAVATTGPAVIIPSWTGCAGGPGRADLLRALARVGPVRLGDSESSPRWRHNVNSESALKVAAPGPRKPGRYGGIGPGASPGDWPEPGRLPQLRCRVRETVPDSVTIKIQERWFLRDCQSGGLTVTYGHGRKFPTVPTVNPKAKPWFSPFSPYGARQTCQSSSIEVITDRKTPKNEDSCAESPQMQSIHLHP
jgi:hypothetical protein